MATLLLPPPSRPLYLPLLLVLLLSVAFCSPRPHRPVLQQRSLIVWSGLFNGLRPTAPYSISGKRKVITHASSEIDGNDSSNSDVPKEGTEDSVSVESLPLETKLQLKLEQKLRMKLAKKIRLRRKCLVRKRRMRKKGRWPPSKMKKNKHV